MNTTTFSQPYFESPTPYVGQLTTDFRQCRIHPSQIIYDIHGQVVECWEYRSHRLYIVELHPPLVGDHNMGHGQELSKSVIRTASSVL